MIKIDNQVRAEVTAIVSDKPYNENGFVVVPITVRCVGFNPDYTSFLGEGQRIRDGIRSLHEILIKSLFNVQKDSKLIFEL